VWSWRKCTLSWKHVPKHTCKTLRCERDRERDWHLDIHGNFTIDVIANCAFANWNHLTDWSNDQVSYYCCTCCQSKQSITCPFFCTQKFYIHALISFKSIWAKISPFRHCRYSCLNDGNWIIHFLKVHVTSSKT